MNFVATESRAVNNSDSALTSIIPLTHRTVKRHSDQRHEDVNINRIFFALAVVVSGFVSTPAPISALNVTNTITIQATLAAKAHCPAARL